MTKIEINKTNEQKIVDELVKAAGRATRATIRDWDAFEKAFKSVIADVERRFCVPDDVDMRAIFSAGGTYAKITELTFRRAGGGWYLEKAMTKRASCSIDWIKYKVNLYAYEQFCIFVKDGRSMQSVDPDYDEPLSAHQRLSIFDLRARRSKLRARRKRKA